MKLTSSATDNITLQSDTHPAEPQRSLGVPARQFTGRSAYEYTDKRGKVKRVPTDTFEQALWSRLASLANTLMNDARYEAVSVDEETGEVSEPVWVTIDAQSLAQRLLDLVWAEQGNRIELEQSGSQHKNPNTVTLEHLEDMVARIASHQRSTWDGAWVDDMRERASRNGTKSKRPKDITVFQVMGFPFSDHSTPEAKRVIALALGKTPRTVERRLKDWREAPSEWVPTSPSRYLSRPEKAPTSTPRYLSRGDQLMALPYEDRPRQQKPESTDWTYLLELPAEAPVTPAVERGHGDDIVSTLTDQTVNSFYALFNSWKQDINARVRGYENVADELAALFEDAASLGDGV